METIEHGPLTELERAILAAMEGHGAGPAPDLPSRRTEVDYTHGVCRCWICRPLRMPRDDQNWMRAVLARHVLRMKEGERMLWLTDYHARHGVLHTEELKVSMAIERRARRAFRRMGVL